MTDTASESGACVTASESGACVNRRRLRFLANSSNYFPQEKDAIRILQAKGKYRWAVQTGKDGYSQVKKGVEDKAAEVQGRSVYLCD